MRYFTWWKQGVNGGTCQKIFLSGRPYIASIEELVWMEYGIKYRKHWSKKFVWQKVEKKLQAMLWLIHKVLKQYHQMKTEDMTEEKTKGRKRHIVTDTMGNLLCVHVHAGNIHDTKGGVYTFEKALYRYPTLIGVRADQGYRGTFKNTFEIFHNLKVDISPRIKNEFEILPVRWVVERTFGWMTWSRRLSKDYEIRTFYQENICIISNLQTLLRRF